MTGSVSALPAKRATRPSVRLSHLSAVAVLAALVAAMFVALQSVSAAACVANPGISLGIGENCTVTHSGKGDTVAVVSEATDGVTITTNAPAITEEGEVTIEVTTGSATGTATVTISDTATDLNNDNDTTDPGEGSVELAKYEVTVLGFGIKSLAIEDDNDNVVSAGPQVTVVATVRSAVSGSQVRLTVPTTGLSIQNRATADPTMLGDGTTQQQTRTVGGADTQVVEFAVNTAGAPTGDYTLTFTADQNGFGTAPADSGEGAKEVTQTLVLTIGDPGTGLASATLSLGNSKADTPYTEDDESAAETGTAPAASGDGINLVIEAFDSLGGKANAGSIDQVIVIAPGGAVTAGAGNTAEVATNQSGATFTEDKAEDNPADNVGSTMVITVEKADDKPGMVTVYAIVSGSGGAATTESLTLSFSGATDSIAVADATDTLRSVNVDTDDDGTVDNDTVTLAATGADSGGIANDPGMGFSITISDSEGNRVNSDKMVASLGDYAGGKRDVTVTGKGATGAALKAGEYTVKLKKGDLEASGMFSVAGSAANVTVTASAMSSDSIGDVITVTATVTDADGNAVSGGTSVMFDVSEDTGLAAIGTGHAGKGTKDGAASVRYAVVGAGHSVISATADDATGVIVIDSTAGATDMAMPEEEASVACLSNLAGFSTWSCGVETSASEIFGFVSARGATAIHLWNGSAWVRYSVVDGTMVPGSSDFMVAENDILYISN